MDNVFYLNFSLAVFLLVTGLIVKKNPHLIAGHRKYHYDEQHSRMVFFTLSYASALIIISNIFFFYLKSPGSALITGIIIITLSPVYLIYRFRQVNIQKINGVQLIGIVTFLMIIGSIGLMIFIVARTPSYKITKEYFVVSGIYGVDIKTSEIDTVTLMNHIPEIILRTNGLDIGQIKKGYFNIEGLGKCKLLLSSHTSPFIFIKTINDEVILINLKTPQTTEKLYFEIESKLN
jgi:hypothetical protein